MLRALQRTSRISLVRVHMTTRRQKRSTKPLTVLGSGQCPQSAQTPTNLYDIDRRGDCTSYNACLTFAFQQRWPSFNCGSCGAYEKEARLPIAGGDQWEGA
jgi:hypothetical protein